MISEDAIKILKERRSVRNFEDKPITKEILEQIVDCARLAPSARNIQPWEFIVITEKEVLENLAKITGMYFVKDAAACIVVVCEDTKYYLEDGSAATENILLAAKAFGIGSCWVAGDKKPYAEDVMNLLKVPEGYKLVSIIPLGYPKEEPPRPEKRALINVIHWERF